MKHDNAVTQHPRPLLWWFAQKTDTESAVGVHASPQEGLAFMEIQLLKGPLYHIQAVPFHSKFTAA